MPCQSGCCAFRGGTALPPCGTEFKFSSGAMRRVQCCECALCPKYLELEAERAQDLQVILTARS